MNNAMIELTSQLLRDHIEKLMKGDWEKLKMKWLYVTELYTNYMDRGLTNENLSTQNDSRIH